MFLFLSMLYRLIFGMISLNCVVLVAGFREDDTVSAFRFLTLLQRNVELGLIYFVANSSPAEAAYSRVGHGVLIKGTNEDGEWSAYQQALDAACIDNATMHGALILNDTVLTHRNFSCIRYLCWLQALRRDAKRDALLAEMNGETSWDFTIFGLPVSPLSSAYLMYIGFDLISALENKVIFHKQEIDQWLAEATVKRFFPTWINLGLRDHLHHWLFGGGWYGSQPLSDENLARFAFKAKAIFHEKALSSRASRVGRLIAVMPENSLMFRANGKLNRIFMDGGVMGFLARRLFIR